MFATLPQLMTTFLLSALLVAGVTHAATPGVVLLLSDPNGGRTQLVEQRGDTRMELAAIDHVRGGIVKGALASKGIAVIAQTEESRDPSWASSLVFIDDRGNSSVLVDRVAHASRPVVAATGEILVSRGLTGTEPSHSKGYGATLRIDALTVEAVDPATGKARVLLRRGGYLLFVAGVTAKEAIIYSIGPGSTPLLAVNLKTSAVRTLAAHVELGRDFSIKTGAVSSVFFTERVADEWRVSSRVLEYAASHGDPILENDTPYQLTDARRMLRGPEIGGVRTRFAVTQDCPHGAGVDEVDGISPDGRWAAALHRTEGEMPRPVLFDLYATKPAVALALTEVTGLRPEIVGVRP